MNNPINTIKLI